ncbi:KTSC domain-containing protein [Bradyrhizobium sp.]
MFASRGRNADAGFFVPRGEAQAWYDVLPQRWCLMALGYLPLLLVGMASAGWAEAETVNVEGRGAVDLTPFACQDITRSSIVSRVCYDATKQTMIVQTKTAYSHYCGVPATTRDSFLNAPSMGQYYNANLKGSGAQARYACRTREF